MLIDIKEPQLFVEKIEALDKSKAYYVFCKSEGRSSMACDIMQQMGLEDVANLLGGITDWHGVVE